MYTPRSVQNEESEDNYQCRWNGEREEEAKHGHACRQTGLIETETETCQRPQGQAAVGMVLGWMCLIVCAFPSRFTPSLNTRLQPVTMFWATLQLP
jgi:hypothetical protein